MIIYILLFHILIYKRKTNFMAEIIGRVGWRNYVSPISPLWNNLVAYWSGDNTANDSKGTYNGTLINGATYSTGKISNGFSFDGVNDYVNISPSLGSTFSKPSSVHSYSAWIYPTSLAGYNWIIQNGTSTTGTSMILNGANLCFFIQGGQDQTTSSATLTINTWTMVTVVYNGAGGVSFYKNGVLINSSGASWGESVATSNTYIGSYVGAAHFFDGKIDEVGAWNRALTATEVTELYNAGAGKQYVAPTPTIVTNGLVLNLDAGNALSYAGTGTTWTDLSGNGNNGTLINGTSYSSANGGVMVFDGVNDSVLGNTNTLNNSQSFTTITWFSANQVIAEQHLTNLKATPPTQLYVAGGKIGTWDYGSLSGGTIVPNTWYMVVCTRDSSGAGKLYINGQYIATSTLKSYSANTQFVIGTFGGGGYYFGGKIGMSQIYNRDLTLSEIQQNFNATKTRFGL